MPPDQEIATATAKSLAVYFRQSGIEPSSAAAAHQHVMRFLELQTGRPSGMQRRLEPLQRAGFIVNGLLSDAGFSQIQAAASEL